MFNINILTILPDLFPGTLRGSVLGRALDNGIWHLNVVDIRNFAKDRYGSVDDTPYGGGAGMLMRADILGDAIDSILAEQPDSKLIFPSPRGKIFNQKHAQVLAKCKNITILCGRFGGIDNRILNFYPFEEFSIGDYIVCGGEVASMVILESCVRLLPGVLGNQLSLSDESFGDASLECDQYTKPQVWRGLAVPDVLISGNHADVRNWQLCNALDVTRFRRPDLLK